MPVDDGTGDIDTARFSGNLSDYTVTQLSATSVRLVDNRGIVVGVSTAINKEASGISYGVAAPDLARFLTACALPPRTVYLHRYSVVDV